MSKTFTLKEQVVDKTDINDVQVERETTSTNVQKEVVTLRSIDQQIATLQDRSDRLLEAKAVLEEDRVEILKQVQG